MAKCKDCIHHNLCADMHRFGIADLPYNPEGAVCEHFHQNDDEQQHLFDENAELISKISAEAAQLSVQTLDLMNRFKKATRESPIKLLKELKEKAFAVHDDDSGEFILCMYCEDFEEIKQKYMEDQK